MRRWRTPRRAWRSRGRHRRAVLHFRVPSPLQMSPVSALTYPSPRVYPKSLLFPGVPALLALVPLAYLVSMCELHHLDVPFWDQWAMVPRLEHMMSGTLSFNDFWQQHNEHRPFVPIALMLLLARLSNWNIGWEIAVNILLGVGIFAVFAAYLFTAWRDAGGAPVWLLPLISIFVFSPVQWENWVWGWQMQVLMCELATALGALLIARSAQQRGAFGGAVACGVWASYSFASGLMFWLAQPAGIWLGERRGRVLRLAVWTIAAAATFASYFYDFHRPPQPSMLSNFASLASLRLLVTYVLTYLGAPIANFDQGKAAVAGAAVLLAFAILVARLWPLRGEAVFLFPFLVGAQTLGTAVISGLGRAWMGVEQGLTSRYTTLTLPLWCAVACLTVLALRTWPAFRPARRVAFAGAAVLLAVTLSSLYSSTQLAVFTVTGRSETLAFARRGLIVGRSHAHMLMLYPNLDEIRERRAALLRLRLSVFRPTTHPTYPVPGPV